MPPKKKVKPQSNSKPAVKKLKLCKPNFKKKQKLIISSSSEEEEESSENISTSADNSSGHENSSSSGDEEEEESSENISSSADSSSGHENSSSPSEEDEEEESDNNSSDVSTDSETDASDEISEDTESEDEEPPTKKQLVSKSVKPPIQSKIKPFKHPRTKKQVVSKSVKPSTQSTIQPFKRPPGRPKGTTKKQINDTNAINTSKSTVHEVKKKTPLIKTLELPKSKRKIRTYKMVTDQEPTELQTAESEWLYFSSRCAILPLCSMFNQSVIHPVPNETFELETRMKSKNMMGGLKLETFKTLLSYFKHLGNEWDPIESDYHDPLFNPNKKEIPELDVDHQEIEKKSNDFGTESAEVLTLETEEQVKTKDLITDVRNLKIKDKWHTTFDLLYEGGYRVTKYPNQTGRADTIILKTNIVDVDFDVPLNRWKTSDLSLRISAKCERELDNTTSDLIGKQLLCVRRKIRQTLVHKSKQFKVDITLVYTGNTEVEVKSMLQPTSYEIEHELLPDFLYGEWNTIIQHQKDNKSSSPAATANIANRALTKWQLSQKIFESFRYIMIPESVFVISESLSNS